MGNIGKNRSFTQKGFSKNFIGLMSEIERQKLCCLNFLEQVFTENSNSIELSGYGTDTTPLIANLKLSSQVGNVLSINSDGLFLTVAQGLSIDENTGAVVLGQDSSVIGFPASISEDRILPIIPGINIIIQDVVDPNLKVFITSNGIAIQGDGSNMGSFSIQDYPTASLFITERVPGKSYFITSWGSDSPPFSPEGTLFFFDSGNLVLSTGLTETDNGATFQVRGNLTTADPNSGVGKWKLGQIKTSSVTLDSTRYVEVNIDGTTVKLAVVN